MQLTQAAVRLEAAVEAQVRLGDAELQSLASELLEVLRPAMRQTLMDVAEMAAQEVSGQLTGQRVDVRLVDGDPELIVVVDEARTTPSPTGDPVEAEARITLRLPAQLKDLITEAAEVAGDSVNSFVVDALRTRAYERASTSSIRDTIDL
jgi:hypothetical protein